MWISNIDARSAALLAVRQATSDIINVALPKKSVWDPAMTRALVWSWLGLHIAGQVLLLLLLATFLFSKRLSSRRHPVVLNFVLTWLLETIPACLLLYGNGHLEKRPDPSLCLYNAALVAGTPPMVASSFLAVVVEVYLMMRSVTARKEYVRRGWLTALLLAAPYVAFIGFSLLTGIVGFIHPEDVTRNAEVVFCTVRAHNLGLYIWSPTIAIVAVTLGLGVALVVLLWRNWRDVRGGNSVVDFNLVVRALCFAAFQVFILVMFMLAIFDSEANTGPKFMQALAPIAVFLIFSTQPDVIRSWFFCFGSDKRDRAGMVRISPPIPVPDEEKAEPDFAFQSNTSSKPAVMRGVPGLHVATEIPQPVPRSMQASTPAPGLRTLSLAQSSPIRTPSSRPTHSPSLSEMSGREPIMLRPDTRSRFAGQHGRHASIASSAGTSSYSDLSWKSTSSGAPLIRTVDGMRAPQATDYQNGVSYRSDAGVLGSAPSNPNRR